MDILPIGNNYRQLIPFGNTSQNNWIDDTYRWIDRRINYMRDEYDLKKKQYLDLEIMKLIGGTYDDYVKISQRICMPKTIFTRNLVLQQKKSIKSKLFSNMYSMTSVEISVMINYG